MNRFEIFTNSQMASVVGPLHKYYSTELQNTFARNEASQSEKRCG